MTLLLKPLVRPLRAEFSSGPCVKRPNWSLDTVLKNSLLGRSHRSDGSKRQLHKVINLIREILNVPNEYRIGIVPASDTGAYEMAMWSLIGEKPVNMLVWESFGAGWANDVVNELKVEDCRILKAEYGFLPNLSEVDSNSDICFTWNGTTSGVRVPNADWIYGNRSGLTFCDATSAAFSQYLDWDKLDVTTFSWQKAMGGEGAHGTIILSPKAINRLEKSKLTRPLPKIFRLTKNGKLIEGIFRGETINTPSMLCVADALDSLSWIKSIGGLRQTVERSNKNFRVVQSWIDSQNWIENMSANVAERSNTSVCMKITSPQFVAMPIEQQRSYVKAMVELLEKERVGYDINGHRDAPPGLRIWCGLTVETADLEQLMPWISWAFKTVGNEY